MLEFWDAGILGCWNSGITDNTGITTNSGISKIPVLFGGWDEIFSV